MSLRIRCCCLVAGVRRPVRRPFLGALIVVGDRRDLLAWVSIMGGLFLVLCTLTQQYAPLAAAAAAGGELASWLANWINMPGIVIVAAFVIL